MRPKSVPPLTDGGAEASFTFEMAGYFAATDSPDERSPPDRLIESHAVADVFVLYRAGLLSPGAAERLENGCWLAVDAAGNLTLDNQSVRLISHPVLPLRAFQCPRCGTDRYRLHKVNGLWACRKCQGLDYSCRHRLRSRGARRYHRVIALRKRIGVSPVLFSAIPPKPFTARRYLVIALEIRKIESAIIEHLRADVANALERRADAKRRRD